MTVQAIIEKKLNEYFQPHHLQVINESYMHNVAEGSESHFKVVVVSDKFDGQRLLARHRQVNSVLSDELENAIHALAMHTYTLEQWQQMNAQAVPNSPDCLGGSKR
ncbi:BolA/IbaG family iron-sulfur metabolism protein [Thalassotalea sp. HSM 43]|uniref:BolA family protein n=1 Tax=Thalassotalea sp. HSM 43 TaxID=2552945 RepID=UPI001081CEA9|nr:BolA/IbaG family iron-sulfur metabolism protein [Thalassotalea sp. HSM 43]QBY05118.1 BolA/IbaG family iron-sulfur metabolism protein [Thalassotalea sp. HSM 43]